MSTPARDANARAWGTRAAAETNAANQQHQYTPNPGVTRNRAERRRAAREQRAPLATLTIKSHAGLGERGRIIEVACTHGTTSIIVAEGAGDDPSALPDGLSARMAVLNHYEEEGCVCTRELRQRFGLVEGGTSW
jgi:hypothetical protein